MSKEIKPTSKIIYHHPILCDDTLLTEILCEDGSLWNYDYRNCEWECILEAGYDKELENCITYKARIKSKWVSMRDNWVTTVHFIEKK